MEHDILVVGAGFSGAVAARVLAEQGRQVCIVEQRGHIGGNAYDCEDANGILVHRYGPHIFHTDSERVFRFLSRFTGWRPYQHKVLTYIDGMLLPFPINRLTLNKLYRKDMNESGIESFLKSVRETRQVIRNSEDVVLCSVGKDLYEKLYQGYSRKHWGCELSELSSKVARRIPVRTNDDDRYFTDHYQFMPDAGYTESFNRMLDHPSISVQLNTSYETICDSWFPRHTIYSGRIDSFFNYCYGRLPYRFVRFEHQFLPNKQQYLPVATVNYPNDYDYTRITEFKHITGQVHSGTAIVREYPQQHGDPYYPIPQKRNHALYARYKILAEKRRNVTFLGRLAEYRYYDMDQAVASAMTAVRRLIDDSPAVSSNSTD